MTAGQMVAVVSHQERKRSRLPAWYRRREATILGFSGLIAFVAIWQIAATIIGLDFTFFFSSHRNLQSASKEVQLPRFWDDVLTSGFELAAGSIVALGLGVPMGLAIGWYRRIGYMFDPWLNFFNSLPRIALLPLIVLWLGLGTETKVAAVALGAFFSIVVPTAQGVKTVDRNFLDVGRSMEASLERKVFTSIVLPATVPFIISGIRIGIGRGLIGVVVAEFYAQTKGIGVIIVKSQQALDSNRMLFGIILFTIAGIGLNYATSLLEARFQRWRPGQDSEE